MMIRLAREWLQKYRIDISVEFWWINSLIKFRILFIKENTRDSGLPRQPVVISKREAAYQPRQLVVNLSEVWWELVNNPTPWMIERIP